MGGFSPSLHRDAAAGGAGCGAVADAAKGPYDLGSGRRTTCASAIVASP